MYRIGILANTKCFPIFLLKERKKGDLEKPIMNFAKVRNSISVAQ